MLPGVPPRSSRDRRRPGCSARCRAGGLRDSDPPAQDVSPRGPARGLDLAHRREYRYRFPPPAAAARSHRRSALAERARRSFGDARKRARPASGTATPGALPALLRRPRLRRDRRSTRRQSGNRRRNPERSARSAAARAGGGSEVTDLGRELDLLVPPFDDADADWAGALLRGGRRTRRPLALTIAAALLAVAVLAAASFGNALAGRMFDRLSAWVGAAPGEPAPREESQALREANARSAAPIPTDTEL